MTASGLSSPRLARLAQQRPAPAREPPEPAPEPERCDLCGRPVPAAHRHLVDVATRQLLCACDPCRLLFDRPAAGAAGQHYRLVPERRLRLDGFVLDDDRWASLRIPVDIAFFFHATPAGRVVAFYPGPMGATESQLELETWDAVAADNPVLGSMEPDVEALLINRARDAREHFVVPIDDCYRLVAIMRTGWRGLAGGREVWEAIEGFFGDLRRRSA